MTTSVSYTQSSTRQVHAEIRRERPRYLPNHLQPLDLPKTCPGCGVFTQNAEPDKPGYYNMNRRSVKAFVAKDARTAERDQDRQSKTYEHILNCADGTLLSQLGLDGAGRSLRLGETNLHSTQAASPPICHRCHDILHHRIGVSAAYPTVQSVQKLITASPYKYNHIYHVLDAADFPLSLIPSLQQDLSLSPQRSSNRRAKTSHFQRDRKAEISFIITRSDLLAPRKEQVDSLMPYIIQVLHDALFRSGKNVRLGNVRCVSSHRGWWTKEIKQDIWNRGGGNWLVGKVNVGKSNLLENIFPKGSKEDVSFNASRYRIRQQDNIGLTGNLPSKSKHSQDNIKCYNLQLEQPNQEQSQCYGGLYLPPARPETPYPVMPLVSSLPGTTACPIRLPFGQGRGEVIDLPGLLRGDFQDMVIEDRRLDFSMRHRIRAEQCTIKYGQSLLIGGLVRLTPTTPDLAFLAYPFVPLTHHVTSTERAIAIHTQKDNTDFHSIARPGIGNRMELAGSFALRWDVTKQRSGPLTKKEAARLSTNVLPFMVLSLDVLIEGCGWIELVAQVRKKSMNSAAHPRDLFDSTPYPRVEVFSPEGKFVGVRRPMGAWLLGGKKPGRLSIGRPRRSMKGAKKQRKENLRES